MDLLTPMIAGAILSILVTKEMLTFFKTRNGKNGNRDKKIDQLHEWHNVRGPDGTFIWWHHGLSEEVRALRKAVEEQTLTTRQLTKVLKRKN